MTHGMLGPVSTGAARSCQSFGNDLSVGRTGHPMPMSRDPIWIRTLTNRMAALCRGDAIRRQRAAIVPRAAGRVLEIGIGSGRNLPFYDGRKVASLIGIGASETLLDRADLPFPLTLREWTPDGLPIAADSIDTVVVTDALRRMADPAATLSEIRRVLKPTGRLLFCEPSKAPDANVACWQRRLGPFRRLAAGRGRFEVDFPQLINRTGFALQAIDAAYLPWRPRLIGFVYWGAATIV